MLCYVDGCANEGALLDTKSRVAFPVAARNSHRVSALTLPYGGRQFRPPVKLATAKFSRATQRSISSVSGRRAACRTSNQSRSAAHPYLYPPRQQRHRTVTCCSNSGFDPFHVNVVSIPGSAEGGVSMLTAHRLDRVCNMRWCCSRSITNRSATGLSTSTAV